MEKEALNMQTYVRIFIYSNHVLACFVGSFCSILCHACSLLYFLIVVKFDSLYCLYFDKNAYLCIVFLNFYELLRKIF